MPLSVSHRFGLFTGTMLGLFAFALTAYAAEFAVSPSELRFERSFAQAQLLVHAEGQQADLTAVVTYQSTRPEVATVNSTGLVLVQGNGDAEIIVTHDGVTKTIPVHVEGWSADPKIDFEEDILPVLYKNGCNSGACHASQYGKGGFTLSVMGFDPAADYQAMALNSRGRRLCLTNPLNSLLLRKPTQEVPHGGGKRFEVGSNDYNLIATWIRQGATRPQTTARKVDKLIVTPAARVGQVGFQQQLQVHAILSDGSQRDVTAWSRFDGMDDAILKVSPSGLVTTHGKGQANVLVRYAGQAELASMVVPFGGQADLSQWTNNNFVDELAAQKFRDLGITPSPLCDDATFLRRAYLDAIGYPPTAEEAKAFVESTDPHKRQVVIDRLLGLTGDPAQDIYNDKYAAWWSLKWADLIRNNSTVLGESGMWALHNWLRESFRTNKPFDQFVRELVTAKGSIFSNGPANYFRIASTPPDLAESTAQLFLGTRLQCAKCHHHPYEKYSQADYYGFAAFFSRVGVKSSSEFGIFGGESVVMVRSNGEVSHPRTGAIMKPTPLHGEPLDDPLDRRVPLAKWLTSPENDSFARNLVNRYVAYLLGRGLVEPIDDLRSTNPPSNVALMDALVKDLRDNKFDVKRLMRSIMSSRLYQLDSQPTAENAADQRFYSHYKVKRLSAESLLDCIDYATGSITKHPNLPLGTRATELPDANSTNAFLMTFGKPKRASVCECERTPDENLAQALHTLNGDILAAKLADAKGRVATIVAAKPPTDDAIQQLYLAALSRMPTADELAAARQFVTSAPSPDEGYQDILWALINSKQFLFVH